ncbi:hypothetical protein HNY73_015744 [Argiope bruennichi]|uniref:MATH domain-containing protein n=1 Tax=Argiope bruennichi TaxID=94029 RepID=A0A8T0ELF7_ARGBR|nr:hypothetical protein HNY73_015744 [Argiope bruennichi]
MDWKFIRYGAILLKVVIYLNEVRPPRFASLTFQENHLSARFEWFVPDLLDKISRAREGRLGFLDSEKFYLSNNGYRMMLRLYPEKASGFLNCKERQKPVGIRFAITVFLQEILPPIASVRLENGVLVAKYSWILQDAAANIGLLQSREKNRLESSVFYSENQGYAMRLAMSLSRRNILSKDEQVVGLFWTLQAGQHDYALQWPFSSVVTLSVIGGVTSLQRVIIPGSSKCPMEAFDRPQSPNNEHSCGFASLLTLSELYSNYIHNDVLHIKVTITLS